MSLGQEKQIKIKDKRYAPSETVPLDQEKRAFLAAPPRKYKLHVYFISLNGVTGLPLVQVSSGIPDYKVGAPLHGRKFKISKNEDLGQDGHHIVQILHQLYEEVYVVRN